MALKPSNVIVALQTGTDRTYYATWSWNKSGTEKYETVWKYNTGDGVWFIGSEGSSTSKQSTYSAPSNAKEISFKVKPVAKKKGAGKNWGWSTTVKKDLTTINIADPGAPTVTLVGNRLTAVIDGYTSSGVTHIQFEFIADDTKVVKTTDPIALQRTHASTYINVEVGKTYKVRARGVISKTVTTKIKSSALRANTAVNAKGQKFNISLSGGSEQTIITKYGPWSAYSERLFTGFEAVKQITSIETYSAYGESGGVRVTWEGVHNFDSSEDSFDSSEDSSDTYEIQYTQDEELFDSGEVQTSDDHKLTHAEITGLELNKTYYFRVRAKRGERAGGWSPIASIAVGTKPGPPTTWSFTDTVSLGEEIILNWAHSSDDGSKQTEAKVTLKVGETTVVKDISGETASLTIRTDDPDAWEEVFGSQIALPTTDFELYWKVSTKGIIPDFSDDSTERVIHVYEPVSLNVRLYSNGIWLWDSFNFNTDTIFTAKSIFADPVDNVTQYPIRIGLNADPDSQTAISYAISITANEDYDTIDFTGGTRHISRGEEVYGGYFTADTDEPNELYLMLYPGDIDLENNINYTISATVAMNSGLTGEATTTFDVALDDEEYEVDADITVGPNYSALIKPVCMDEFGNQVTDVYLSVYRREYDGTFTPIEVNIDGALELTVTDPHPSLDYARYRIVAISKRTGNISSDDIPGYKFGIDSIVMQWAEAWSNFDVDDSENVEDLDQAPSEGSLLVLPYNIDILASHSPEVSLVNYIGKEHPVSYYGTQKGETGTWNCEIPKNDLETLYAIRRLARYTGDVYVREPSGIGYWAQVTVSYNLQHNKTTVPVSFSITRVSGGI
jgi:hypothetical protein